ncbi:MAG: cell division protein SepF [Caldisericia bacterium]|nr:cell division protein SepF [Caldisericia bacterium]
MGIGDWFKSLLGMDDEEEEVYEGEDATISTPKIDPVIKSALSKMTVVVMNPTSFEEARKSVDSLKHGKPIMANFEETESDIARRFIDFVSGACYALDGMVEKIGKNVFLFATKNIAVSSEKLRMWDDSAKKSGDDFGSFE